MVAGQLAIAGYLFLRRGGGTNRWLTIMTSSGDDLETYARIWCSAERLPHESDDSLRQRCFENWQDIGDESSPEPEDHDGTD